MAQDKQDYFHVMMALAHGNHLFAEFLLGWLALPATDEQCKQAVGILTEAVRLGRMSEYDDLDRIIKRLKRPENS
jgi:hypothetical protein